MKKPLDTPKDIERAMTLPSSVFDQPAEVVESDALSRAQKLEILRRWELDSIALQRATDENMSGGEPPRLDEINAALAALEPKGAA